MGDMTVNCEQLLCSGELSKMISAEIEELSLLWRNFLNSNKEQNKVVQMKRAKKTRNDSNNLIYLHFQTEWLNLFMFKYEILITEPRFNTEIKQ